MILAEHLNELSLGFALKDSAEERIIKYSSGYFDDGESFTAVCPFHDDQTTEGSLVIQKETHDFKCEECDRVGNLCEFPNSEILIQGAEE